MSDDSIATIATVLTLLVGLGAGFGWMIVRMDKRLDTLSDRIDAKTEEVRTQLGERITNEVGSLGERITGVERELVEVKIALARLEGPRRHLVTAR